MVNQVFVSAIAGVALTTAAVLPSSPAQAALLKFEFTTNQGGVGSFVLNTDTPLSSEVIPPLPDVDSNGNVVFVPGKLYASAVSSFSFSSPGAGALQYNQIDYVLFPSIPSFNGLPLAFISPRACGFPDQDCPMQLQVGYLGDVANLPDLPTDPLNYFLFNIAAYKAAEPGYTFFERVNSTTATVIPTPALLPGLIGFSIGVLRKRRMADTNGSLDT